jgi:tetratricopeptide (TPR) repeat protein
MKKPLLVLGLIVALALTTITLIKHGTVGGISTTGGADAAEIEKVKSFWAWYNQGSTLRAKGEFAAAVPAFRKSLAINPHHEDSLYYLGTSLFELGEYREAEEMFRKIVDANPSSGRAWSQLGNTLSILAPGATVDFDGAQRAYERSAELNREQAGPFLRLGVLDLNRGRWRAARGNFQLAAGFGAPEGSYLVAYSLFLEKRDPETLPFLRKVLDSYAKEKKNTGRGVSSEGDVKSAAQKPLSPLDQAAFKSILLLNAQSTLLDKEAAALAVKFQIPSQADGSPQFRALGKEAGIKPDGGRGAWADFDGDGWPDLIVTGLGQPVTLYRNRDGRFSDVTAAAGLGGVRDAWDAVWADYDGDGFPDLYFIRSGFMGSGQNALYRNNHDGTFSDVTSRAGLEGKRSTARACFAEFTGSGHPDLVEIGTADSAHSSVRLYRNIGAGFVEITQQAGLESHLTAVDCAPADYDHDGKPDLLVLYWKQNAALYHNQGAGKFSDVTSRAGLSGIHAASFSALFFDYDNDGWQDLLISSHAPFEQSVRYLLQPEFRTNRDTPRLYHNRQNGTFAEVSQSMGLDRNYGTMQALAADFDSDGWTDLLFVNGSLDALRLEPAAVLRNREGRGYEESIYLKGLKSPANFIGGAVADFDRDGRPDVYLGRNLHLPTSVISSGIFANRLPTNRRAIAQR